jgi:peptidoglycan-associated lipoprotein
MFRLKDSLSIAALVVAGVLGGCASGVKLDEKPPVEERKIPADDAAAQGAAGQGTAQSSVANVDLAKNANAQADNLPRTIYFDFDSYVVKDEYRPVIEAHAKMLNADRKRHEVVEGHTDERGGSEYNLALGQKRAEAVLKSLTLLGVTDAQVEAVSYGKERPAVDAHDEAAWAKNRRAELKGR